MIGTHRLEKMTRIVQLFRPVVETICLLIPGVGSVVLLLAAIETWDVFLLVCSVFMFAVMVSFQIQFGIAAIRRNQK